VEEALKQLPALPRSQNTRGSVEVPGKPGDGTTFQIYLPRCKQKPDQKRADSSPKHLLGGNETILLVEDEPVILDLATKILRYLGYTVLAAATPRKAIESAATGNFVIDLLITDVVMPEMNGRELAERLLSQHPGLKCLYMSGYTTDIIAEQGVLEEGLEFIHKPFACEELAAKIRELLD
jgi:two-component system, cell cycle sensor histidine kinase and response regulator CckA